MYYTVLLLLPIARIVVSIMRRMKNDSAGYNNTFAVMHIKNYRHAAAFRRMQCDNGLFPVRRFTVASLFNLKNDLREACARFD